MDAQFVQIQGEIKKDPGSNVSSQNGFLKIKIQVSFSPKTLPTPLF